MSSSKNKEYLNKCKNKFIQKYESNRHIHNKDYSNYEYIINIIDVIHLLLSDLYITNGSVFNQNFLRSLHPVYKLMEYNLKNKPFNPTYKDMESTLKLLICGIAYIKNLNFNSLTLNNIYNNLLNITNLPYISKRMYMTIDFQETDRQMRFLITLMGHIHAIMAKGKSEWGYQIGLKGSDSTFNNVKEIDYRLNPIQYLFGVQGALLQRYLSKSNCRIGEKRIKSLTNSFTNDKIDKYLAKKIIGEYHIRNKINDELAYYKTYEPINNKEFNKKYGMNIN